VGGGCERVSGCRGRGGCGWGARDILEGGDGAREVLGECQSGPRGVRRKAGRARSNTKKLGKDKGKGDAKGRADAAMGCDGRGRVVRWKGGGQAGAGER
jgi:hypothetical protein